MKFTASLLVLWLLIASVLAQDFGFWLARKDQACEPSGVGLDNFDGIRIQHQVVLGQNPLHHLRFSSCSFGNRVGMDGYLPMRTNETGDYVVMPWGAKICAIGPASSTKCYWMARNRHYGFQTVPMAVPGQIIGALYECPGNSDDDGMPCFDESDLSTAQPDYVLMADDPFHSYFEMANDRHFVLRIPFAMAITTPYTQMNTTDGMEWQYLWPSRVRRAKMVDLLNAESMSPLEDYVYSQEDLNRRDAADKKLLPQSPWKGWFQQAQVPRVYNSYMGPMDNCKCSQVLSKFLNTGADSVSQLTYLSDLNTSPDTQIEQQCLLEFPELYDKLLAKFQTRRVQTRPHLMPYKTRSIVKLTSTPDLITRRFLHMVERLYSTG